MNVTRRAFMATVALAATGAMTGRATAQASRKNVVVIFTDDQCFRAIGYNNPLVKTPHLDALATSGVIYDRAYIATPICAASRAAMMTGVFPVTNGTVGLDTAAFVENIVHQHRFTTLPERLRAAGYLTAFAGKSHLGPPADYGFEMGEEQGTKFNDKPNTNDTETFPIVEAMLPRIAADGRPFFFWLASHQPHIPLLPEQQWLDGYDEAAMPIEKNFLEQPPDEGSIYNQGLPGEAYYRDSKARNNYGGASAGPPRASDEIRTFTKGYYATISHLDDQIGRFVEQLKANGLYDNTVIIFLADNGYHLGTHGLGNKITMHEEAVRVPMFIHYAGQTIGERSMRLTSSLDVYPTVLTLAGIEIPTGLAGTPLDTPRAVPYVGSECVGVGGEPGMGHRMVRSRDWKYVLTDVNEEYLFDEVNDPYELTNLAADPAHSDMLATMRRYMTEWMAKAGDTHAKPPAA